MAGIRTRPRFYTYPVYLQVWWQPHQNEGAIVPTKSSPLLVYGNKIGSQGQVTPKRIVRSRAKSNSSEILCLTWLLACLKMIRSKLKAPSCPQHFSHYKSTGAFGCHGNQIFDQISPKNLTQSFPHPNDASYKIWSRLVIWPHIYRYLSLKVWTTDGRQTTTTDDRRTIAIL